MTKTEHVRLITWRFKILQHAEAESGSVAQTCRYFGITRKTYYNVPPRRNPVAEQ